LEKATPLRRAALATENRTLSKKGGAEKVWKAKRTGKNQGSKRHQEKKKQNLQRGPGENKDRQKKQIRGKRR